MHIITKHILAVEQLILSSNNFTPAFNSSKTSVSAWSVGEHLHHLLLVNQSVLTKLLANESMEGKPTTLYGRITLLVGILPRGKGKSPKSLLPQILNQQDITQLITQQLATIETLKNKGSFALQCSFPHPYFGLLTTEQWLRFIQIHTNHHIKIIKDIIA